MSNLYKNIAYLCEEKGIKGAKLCNDIGMSKGILTDLKMGRRTGVNAVTAQKIASYFGVSVGYLLGEEKEKKPDIKYMMEGNNMSMAENMDEKNIFASNLKKYMKLQGKSRTDISNALGISYFTVTTWVNGTKYPRIDKIERLAQYFGIQKSDLIEEKEPATKDDERLAEFINLFTKLSPEQQDFVILQIKGVLSNKKI